MTPSLITLLATSRPSVLGCMLNGRAYIAQGKYASRGDAYGNLVAAAKVEQWQFRFRDNAEH